MHYAEIDDRTTFECFTTLSLCPTGLGEITQGYWWSRHSRLPHRVAELRRAHAHTTKFWWNVYSYYRTWLLIYKVYCKYISRIENIAKTSGLFLQPGMTSSSTSSYYKKHVNQYCSYKSVTQSLIAKRMFHIQAIHKNPCANYVKCRFSLYLQLFSVVLKMTL